MKIKWEAEDIKNVGLRVEVPGTNEVHMLGYQVGLEENRYCLISLDDGMIFFKDTPQEMAEVLNKGGYVPIVLFEQFNVWRDIKRAAVFKHTGHKG